MWIKKEDKCKLAFMTLKELFKPTIIFFEIINSPVMFQTIINKIFWNLINTGKVTSFIDNIIVGIEEKEEHDEVIEEVVRRLSKNNLYVKPERYKWKIRKVRFLGVVIGLERIKIEEEKIKDVLNWLTLKEVKDVQKFLELANYYQQFIKDFTVIARLLYDLVKKNQKWDWTEKQERAF